MRFSRDHRDDPVHQEITSFVSALNEDEQIDIVALVWLGRGDDVVDNWRLLRDQADQAHNNRTASYLLGMPLLDHLKEGLNQLGQSCESDELGRL